MSGATFETGVRLGVDRYAVTGYVPATKVASVGPFRERCSYRDLIAGYHAGR